MDYSNSAWPDKATFYNGNDITYDASGNPTSLDGATLQWENGRWLKSYSKGAVTSTYTYDSNGIRVSKYSSNSEKYTGENREYTTVDGRITSEYVSGGGMGISSYDYRVYYRYDENNSPIGFDLIKNGTTSTYTYVKNIQGDILGIISDSTRRRVVTYVYDAWGKLLSTSGSAASTVGKYNSLRYRGYYYDSETGYYYLQSRYYDPSYKRFINADEPELISYLTQASTLGGNLFAYCENNAVMGYDPSGEWSKDSLKKESWLFKAVAKVNPNFVFDKKYDFAKFSKVGIELRIYTCISYSTNKLGLMTISKNSLNVSFLGISLGVGWSSISASFNTTVSKHTVTALWQKDWTKTTIGLSISFTSKTGIKAALVMSFSVNHLTKIAAKAVIAGAIVAAPYLSGAIAPLIASLGSAGSVYYSFSNAFA